MEIRKTVTIVEERPVDSSRALDQPAVRVAAIAVVRNPLAGGYDENLDVLNDGGADLGRDLARRALRYVDKNQIAMVGKGAIIGNDGEPEHGAALVQLKFAQAVREVLGGGRSGVIAEKVIGPPNSPIRISLEPWNGAPTAPPGVADVMELRLPDSPRDDEIVVVLVVSGGTASPAAGV